MTMTSVQTKVSQNIWPKLRQEIAEWVKSNV
jgi:hypothetical protein